MKNRSTHQQPGGTLTLPVRRTILAHTLKTLRATSRQLARDYLRWYGKQVGQA